MFFGRWMGPAVGTIVGVIGCTIIGFKNHSLGFWPPLMLGGGVGFAGGFLVMLAEPAKRKEPEDVPSDSQVEATLSANILCLLGLISFFMPFFGVVLSGLALCVNWRVKGWAWWLSWVGLLLGLVMTSLIVWHWTSPANGS